MTGKSKDNGHKITLLIMRNRKKNISNIAKCTDLIYIHTSREVSI